MILNFNNQEDIHEYLSSCNYNCNKGKIYLPAVGLFQDCPHCSEIYDKISKGKLKDEGGKDIYKILCIPYKYRDIVYEKESVFPRSIISTTSEESRREINNELVDIYKKIFTGDNLENDYLFYLGMETDILPYIYTVLRKAYANGKKVVPYISTLELIQLYKAAEEPEGSENNRGREIEEELGVWFNDYCKSDICIISIPPSAGRSSIDMLFTLLRMRQKRNLKTVIFSETQGVSRELGYILNNDDRFIRRFIESVAKTDRPVQEKRRVSQPSRVVQNTKSLENKKESSLLEKNLGVLQEDVETSNIPLRNKF